MSSETSSEPHLLFKEHFRSFPSDVKGCLIELRKFLIHYLDGCGYKSKLTSVINSHQLQRNAFCFRRVPEEETVVTYTTDRSEDFIRFYVVLRINDCCFRNHELTDVSNGMRSVFPIGRNLIFKHCVHERLLLKSKDAIYSTQLIISGIHSSAKAVVHAFYGLQ